jgi:hypothetical protein
MDLHAVCAKWDAGHGYTRCGCACTQFQFGRRRSSCPPCAGEWRWPSASNRTGPPAGHAGNTQNSASWTRTAATRARCRCISSVPSTRAAIPGWMPLVVRGRPAAPFGGVHKPIRWQHLTCRDLMPTSSCRGTRLTPCNMWPNAARLPCRRPICSESLQPNGESCAPFGQRAWRRAVQTMQPLPALPANAARARISGCACGGQAEASGVLRWWPLR